MMCLCVVFFMFLVLEDFWASWICGFILLTKFRKNFSHYFFKSFFSVLPIFFPKTSSKCILAYLKLSPSLLRLYLLFFNNYLFSLHFNLGCYYCLLNFSLAVSNLQLTHPVQFSALEVQFGFCFWYLPSLYLFFLNNIITVLTCLLTSVSVLGQFWLFFAFTVSFDWMADIVNFYLVEYYMHIFGFL